MVKKENKQLLTEEKWKAVDKHFKFIRINLDVCCQDLCSGQEAKYRLDEAMEILVDIRENYEK